MIEGLQKDTRWADILQELQSDPKTKVVIQGHKDYRLSHELLAVQQRDRDALDRDQRIVVPNDPVIKSRIMERPFGVPKGTKQIQRSSIGQISLLKSETTYWDVRSAKNRRVLVESP